MYPVTNYGNYETGKGDFNGAREWEKMFHGRASVLFSKFFFSSLLSKEVPILPSTNLSVNVISLLCNENSVTKDGHFLTASSILILFPFILPIFAMPFSPSFLWTRELTAFAFLQRLPIKGPDQEINSSPPKNEISSQFRLMFQKRLDWITINRDLLQYPRVGFHILSLSLDEVFLTRPT